MGDLLLDLDLWESYPLRELDLNSPFLTCGNETSVKRPFLHRFHSTIQGFIGPNQLKDQ